MRMVAMLLLVIYDINISLFLITTFFLFLPASAVPASASGKDEATVPEKAPKTFPHLYPAKTVSILKSFTSSVNFFKT